MVIDDVVQEKNKINLMEISLGSADDPKVEAFYYKNGYRPIEIVAKDKAGYEKELEKLRRRHNPQEAIFIFEKRL